VASVSLGEKERHERNFPLPFYEENIVGKSDDEETDGDQVKP